MICFSNQPEQKDRGGDSHGRVLHIKEEKHYKRRNDLDIGGIVSICNELARSGGGVVDNTLDYQSRGRKIDPPLLRSFG